MDNEEILKEFRGVIRKDYEGCLDNNLSEEKDIEVYVEALYQGYLDACRTFKWLPESKVKKCKKDDKKREIIKGILQGEETEGVAYRIKNYLEKGSPDGYSEFDDIHRELCENLICDFSSKNKNADISYGQAQKIINMAFKYLYCCKCDDEMKERFDACHMPLDSFSLEWFKRHFKEYDFTKEKVASKLEEKLFKGDKNKSLLLKMDSIGSWSSMESIGNMKKNEVYQGEKYPYEFYRDMIKAYCKDYNINSPLELDFIVWPKMQKIMAAEAFIKAFEEDDDNWVKNAIKNETYDIKNLDEILKKRLHKIRPLICDRTDSQVCKKK